MSAFRKLIGWEPGGAVVAYPTEPEQTARTERERWKAERAGKGLQDVDLWLNKDQIDRFKQNLRTDASTRKWWERFIKNAEAVAELPLSLFATLISEQGPWTFAGSFCPNCIGTKSPRTQHAGFWDWSVLDPDKLTCPYCLITYPHPDYPENGRLDLPRLGWSYSFHISASEVLSPDWRDGKNASNFADMPTHVSFVGEIRTVKLAWCLGQVEPLGVAYAVTGDQRYADVVHAILSRLADVYANYPVFSYGQEYIDADPAYAIEHVDELPTPFRRAASLGTYTGVYGGRTGNRGMDRTTPSTSYYTNAEWGSSRLGREKASNGQLFLSLFKGYDLIQRTVPANDRTRIEQDFLLELYLDARGLSKRVNNKSGPGAASRVAVGIFYDDSDALEEGLAHFHEIMESQFYEDGSWMETPIYGAKSMFEGLSEIPEMLRGRIDLYDDGLYRKAFETYGEAATPLDTQPAIGDSTAEYRLQPILADIARIRFGLDMPYGPQSLAGFGVRSPMDVGNNSGYVPSLNCTGDDRANLDGPVGFGSVGHINRRPVEPSWISMFNEERPVQPAANRSALNRYYNGRKLVCLGFGEGSNAVQLYCDGGDGRTTHRHQAPLSLLLFAGGREVFPDQGYIGDHPANAWIKATVAHNTVVIDEQPARPATRTELKGFVGDGPFRFMDIETEIPSGTDGGSHTLRRAFTLIPKPDGLPILIDVLDISGGSTHDYIIRANNADGQFDTGDLVLSGREQLYAGVADPGAYGFRTAGNATGDLTVCWGEPERVWGQVMTSCTEIITFKSPAWRNRMEAFEEPDRSWDALVLRHESGRSRTVVAYDVGGHFRSIKTARIKSDENTVEINLLTGSGEIGVSVRDGECTLEGI